MKERCYPRPSRDSVHLFTLGGLAGRIQWHSGKMVAQVFLRSYVIFFNEVIFFSCLLILEREREGTGEGQRETEGDTESKAGSRLQAVSREPAMGLELTNCETMT